MFAPTVIPIQPSVSWSQYSEALDHSKATTRPMEPTLLLTVLILFGMIGLFVFPPAGIVLLGLAGILVVILRVCGYKPPE